MATKRKIIIDVSERQLKIDWQKAKAYIDGAIIRIGYGDDQKDQNDLYAAYNLRECQRLGIPFGVYIYSYAASEKQIKSEIAHTARVCAGYKPAGGFWSDLEERACSGIWRRAAELWQEAFPEGGIYSWQWAFEQQLKGLDCGRWIAAYGSNSGRPEEAYRPTIWADGWQYTSKGSIPGINGNVDVSEWYGPFGETDAKDKPSKQDIQIVYKKDVAVLLFTHLCTHKAHGYTMDMQGRQGSGTETVDILGHKYTIKGGDRDCSSAIISAFEAAGISCGGATYTGDMRECMVGSGNFEVKPMSYTAQAGDVYLNEESHTALCLSAVPDILGEFSINEKGTGYGGQIGDQKQQGEYDDTLGRGESHLRAYYDYPWDFILRCTNDEIAFTVNESDGTDQEQGETAETPQKAPVPRETAREAAKVLLNDYGSGDARRARLGASYEAVQAAVDKVLPENREGLIDTMADFIARL